VRHEEDALIGRVADALRTPERIDPSFDARVMAEVHALPAPRRRPSLWAWLRQPRPVAVSPIGGLAFGGAMAALLLVAVMKGEPTGGRDDGGVVVDGGNQNPQIVLVSERKLTTTVMSRGVQFAILEPGAKTVAVVGDFNDWKPDSTMLTRGAAGVWTVAVPLEPGRYTYNFLVDDETWKVDPAMPTGPVDEFAGRPSSVLIIGGPAR
jgi:hypothetical protein